MNFSFLESMGEVMREGSQLQFLERELILLLLHFGINILQEEGEALLALIDLKYPIFPIDNELMIRDLKKF
jgi:hypothetical protein